MSERKNPKPNREPDREVHGEGKAPQSIQLLADGAYYAEFFVDAMGDPRSGSKAWWHLKLWERP